MSRKALDRKTNSTFGRRQVGKDPRRATVGCAVTDTEKDQILWALERAGLPDQSAGVRNVLLLFANNKRVLDLVTEELKAA